MKLVPIIAIFAFAQGTLARSNLCKLGQRYCGSAMKQFDNAGMRIIAHTTQSRAKLIYRR